MIAFIYTKDGKFVEGLERAPKCGDYCDRCGDCLACYNDGCTDGDGCLWVLYEELDAERIAELRAALLAERPAYEIRACRGHFHVTCCGEDLMIDGDPFASRELAEAAAYREANANPAPAND